MMNTLALSPLESRPVLLHALGASVMLAGAGLGAAFGEPVVMTVAAWFQTYLVPAFIELYASGIPFCG